MEIRSATALRNDYDGMVRLSKEKQTPIFLTRNGDGEMVFLPIELWEKREAELNFAGRNAPAGTEYACRKPYCFYGSDGSYDGGNPA